MIFVYQTVLLRKDFLKILKLEKIEKNNLLLNVFIAIFWHDDFLTVLQNRLILMTKELSDRLVLTAASFKAVLSVKYSWVAESCFEKFLAMLVSVTCLKIHGRRLVYTILFKLDIDISLRLFSFMQLRLVTLSRPVLSQPSNVGTVIWLIRG